MNCLRCDEQLQFLSQYRFESQENKRGLFAAIFDLEKHLIFDIYVCPNCGKTEFIYKGKKERLG